MMPQRTVLVVLAAELPGRLIFLRYKIVRGGRSCAGRSHACGRGDPVVGEAKFELIRSIDKLKLTVVVWVTAQHRPF